VQNLTFTNAKDTDAAIKSFGALTLSGSTVAANHGDGISVSDTTTITNTTIASNGTVATANVPDGGIGIVVDGPTTPQNDTITGNGDYGVGNFVLQTTTTLNNSIVWGNAVVSLGMNCAMSANSSTGSLDGDDSCGVDFPSTDPQLGALASNGGPSPHRGPPRPGPR